MRLSETDKRTVFPPDDLPCPDHETSPCVLERQLSAEEMRVAIKENLNVQIALSELRRYSDIPRNWSVCHNVGFMDAEDYPRQANMLANLFGHAETCSFGGVPHFAVASRPRSAALSIYDELRRGGEIHPMVAHFMEDGLSREETEGVWQITFSEDETRAAEALAPSDFEFFDYFLNNNRNTGASECFPVFGRALRDVASDKRVLAFSKMVDKLFVYVERDGFIEGGRTMFVSWHRKK
ncbi:MAG: hypothetical protein LBG71_07605 [Clostridiales Family XIII bacterium]|jgi:hypothetical protein|nr:hypothetical protein [Clostridiales Family XIII bacterium]